MGRVLYFAYHKIVKDIEPANLTALNFQSNNDTEIINNVNELKFKFLSEINIDGKNYYKYFCKFFIHKKMTVYSDGSIIKGYEIPYEFYAFKPLNSDVIFFDVKTNVGKKFVSILNKRTNQNIFEEFDFNIEDVLKKVRTVNLAWFKMDNSSRISSQALSGYNIKGTPEFDELSTHSIKSSIEIEYLYKGLSINAYISRKNSIFLRANFEPKEVEINIVTQIFNELIL